MSAPPPLPAPIRLLLVADHPVMRAGMANVLSIDPDFEIVAQADGGETALALWRQHQPDVTLLDISMGGIDTLRRMRQDQPAARVLMLTSSEASEDVRYALEAGACGFVSKNIRAGELAEAIRTVHSGGRIVGEDVGREITQVEGVRHPTPWEMDVLGLARQGFTNGEIGRLLGISERSARAHMGTITEDFESGNLKA
ncbi:MAG: response regulator transcription factor [Luteolibacter sp.]